MKKSFPVQFIILTAAILLVTSCAVAQSTATTSAATATSGSTSATVPKNTTIRLSTTTSVNDSGLLPVLQKAFEADTVYKLEIISNGSGAAIKLGETGDADVLLVHSKASEEQFVANGFGIKRISFMHNFFVIAGPEDDPAKIADVKTGGEAFAAIAAAKATFVSRGDQSGTNTAELKIWTAIKIDPSKEQWYVAAGKGMGACLIQAAEMKAYCLTDKATFLTMANKGSLKILLGESNDMKNVYSLIAVNPQKNPGVNIDGANAFIAWMQSEKALKMIGQYGADKYGEPLFMLGE